MTDTEQTVSDTPFDNGEKMEATSNDTRFKSGHPGGPGRPKGARNKVSELFLEDFYDVWERKGKQALEYIADNEQVRFVAAAVQILPKGFQLTVDSDQTTWVINADPRGLTEEQWRAKHGLENGASEKQCTA